MSGRVTDEQSSRSGLPEGVRHSLIYLSEVFCLFEVHHEVFSAAPGPPLSERTGMLPFDLGEHQLDRRIDEAQESKGLVNGVDGQIGVHDRIAILVFDDLEERKQRF